MLDLTKLAALELPQKEIEVEILGEKQNLKIQALDDESAIRINAIIGAENIPVEEKELKIRRDILRYGVPDITEEQISLLMTKAATSVAQIMLAIRDITAEYGTSRNSLREQAEKNSGKEAADTTLS